MALLPFFVRTAVRADGRESDGLLICALLTAHRSKAKRHVHLSMQLKALERSRVRRLTTPQCNVRLKNPSDRGVVMQPNEWLVNCLNLVNDETGTVPAEGRGRPDAEHIKQRSERKEGDPARSATTTFLLTLLLHMGS